MQPRSRLLKVVYILSFLIIAALLGPIGSLAAEQHSDVPAWLRAHIGDGDGQIALVVLERARTLYLRKTREGVVKNPCYFAMDATRPHALGNAGRRFYVVCEADRSFRAISSGHGGGRHLRGIVNFANGKRCAKNFGNAQDSSLTAGGAYITRETKTSFKGYYRVSGKQDVAFKRSFVQFDGEGETANARERVIGGHPAQVLKGMCVRKKPASSYADKDGYVPYGKLVDYAGGRSNGCTSWSPADAVQIIPLVKNSPTTLYIYPESRDIAAIARAKAAGQALSGASAYWNASCLKEIGTPKFWPRKTLEPIIAQSDTPDAVAIELRDRARLAILEELREPDLVAERVAAA